MAEVPLPQHHDMVKALASDRANQPFNMTVLPRCIGFRTADQIAAKLGIEVTALIRVRAGISYALAEAMDDGHCGLPAEELVPLTQKLLEVPADLIATALDLESWSGTARPVWCPQR
jgi:exodeoxyribonuclease V alpha subunit